MTKASHKLTTEQQIELVQRLAGYDSTRAIVKWLREEYGITLTRQTVLYYDPTSYCGRHGTDRWRSLFWETRKAITAGRADIGAANKMVRVRWLDAMARE